MDENMANLIKVILFSIVLGMLLSGCTVSIMLTHSNGTDNDVDSTPTTEAKTNAKLSIPTSIP